MTADELPAELFTPGGVWFLVFPPPPTSAPDMLSRIVLDGPAARKYLPLFTSEAKAHEFTAGMLARGGRVAQPFAFKGVAEAGTMMDAVANLGVHQAVIDPDPATVGDPADAERIAIRDATNAMHRHVRPPSLN